jgi:N-acetylglucosaminyldiphosphoundecaprenol N-acetyl-beta-D-mannosaminyltransferase
VESAISQSEKESSVSGRDLQILGVRIDHADRRETIEKISSFIKEPTCKVVITVNPEHVMLAQDSNEFKAILNRGDLNVPDGIGVVWASRLLGRPVRERVSGADLLPDICRLCARESISIFLLGGAPGVAERAAESLRLKLPSLVIAGTSSRDPGAENDEASLREINESGASVLAVAYGSPTENLWIARNQDLLQKVRVAIGVGGALDFISGEMPRAPEWMQRSGLEWLYRLLRQPTRLRRMLRLPRFAVAVLRQRRSMKKDQ